MMFAMIQPTTNFMLGAIVMASVVAGLFFLRFWRRTRDRLFLMFAAAFWLMAVNWAALAFTQADEIRTAFYVVRLVAFVLILVAIIDKNRSRGGAGPMGS
jgi:hypothetical protein